jgi:hypothetical protein
MPASQNYSQWIQLSDAIKLLMATDLSEEDAQHTLCAAISDGIVHFRVRLGRHTTRDMVDKFSVLREDDLDIPPPLLPKHLDFKASRPNEPWLVRRDKRPHITGWWTISLLEVWQPDIVALSRTAPSCPARPDDESAHHGSNAAPASRVESGSQQQPRRRPKTQTGRDRARMAIQALFPAALPDQATVPNSTLCKQVSERLKDLGLAATSDDTILRAAGRRK